MTLPREKPRMQVYLIGSVKHNVYKIGITKDSEYRVRVLDTPMTRFAGPMACNTTRL